jgi:hypothetical protein
LFSPANVKEATAMHPPDGPLARLHSPERKPLFRYFPQKIIPHENPYAARF